MQNSRFFFVLLAVCAAAGIGNIWLYPYFSFSSSGLFFIPYLIALLVAGVPLLVLEFSIGQYFDKNIVDLFASIRKWFSGIGWLMLINAFIAMSIFAVMLAWHIIYLFVSFGFQWENNSNLYFFKNVLQSSDGINGFTHVSLPVFIALIIAWAVIFFFVKKGFETIKKTFLIAGSVFSVLLLFFVFYSLALDNALNGVYSFIKPSFNGLADIDVWIVSFYSVILSIGVSFGIMPLLSRKSEKGFIAGGSFIVIFSELLAGLAIGFIIAGFLGFLSLQKNIGIGQLVFSNQVSVFTVFAEAFPLMNKGIILSLLFFLFMSILFIFAAASLAYAISHVIVHKFKTKHINASILVCGLGFLAGLVFVIRPGVYLMDIISHFSAYGILFAVLFEAVAIGWIFNSEKISDFINSNSAIKMGNLWRFVIRYLVPIIIILLLLFQLKSDLSSYYNNYPLWALLVFGLGTVAASLAVAFLMPQKIWDRR